ncbi:MAG: AMP-binding protein [Campylobacterales bacterium]|nr:AMP-binding protein [Campylobacterales bacterium]
MSFASQLERYASRTCLIESDGATHSYAEVAQLCDRLTCKLPKERCLLLILCDRNAESLIGYLAALRGKHAVMMLDERTDAALLEAIIAAYRPNLIWKKHDENAPLFAWRGYGLYGAYTEAPTLHDDLALLLGTSGSTGSPKMVRLSRRNLSANCQSIIHYLPIRPDDVAITSLPFHYSYGLSIIHTYLEVGAALLLSGASVLERTFWEQVERFGVTTLQGVPYHYELFLRTGLPSRTLPHVRYLTQAGGRLDAQKVAAIHAWACRSGKEFFVMYGQTEATARIAYLPPDALETHPHSIGLAIPGGTLSLIDPQSQTPIGAPGVEGELIYQGANVMMGYAQSADDLSAGDTLGGLLHTGDLAVVDEEGFYTITGRLGRFIKLHGNRVGLDELQQRLHVEGFETICTGSDNTLLIVTTDPNAPEAISAWIKTRLGFHHSVYRCVHVGDIPRLSSGKIDYQTLMERCA